MREPRRLVIHVGLEKTGSTSLQASLHRNPAALARHSVIYPSHNLAYGWENHKRLVECYDVEDVGDRWLKHDPRRRAAAVASLIHEIESARERTAVISAEHFSSRFKEPQIRALHADFARFDCRIVIVLRDHLSRLRSAYEDHVVNGGASTLDQFVEGIMQPGCPGLRYSDLVASWARVFGRDRVTLVRYDTNVVPKVLACLAPGLAAEPRLDKYRLRVSAGADVVAALRLVNAVAAASEAGGGAAASWATNRQRRLQVRAWLRHASPRGAARFSLEPARLARLAELAASDAARLEAAYGFVLEPADAATFAQGDAHETEAELLARALLARTSRPWAKASLIGMGLAIATTLRDEVAMLLGRRKLL